MIMEQVTLKFFCKNHSYKTMVFDNYVKAISYLACNTKPLGTTKILINF